MQILNVHILSVNRSLALTELLQKAEEGKHAEAVMTFDSGKYQLAASPVTANDEVIGIVVLILDVTEKEKAEQMRREFTANVSHELKTPLHTISGYAELLSNDMVKQEDITAFSKRIYTEAGRMICLVEDIIKLSHLDEGAEDMKQENTDLFVLADHVVTTLMPEAKKTGVAIELHGESAVLCGIPQLLESIVYNLCDNAIKYNRKNGFVSVTVKNEEASVVLSVVDTGIGIPEEHKERIFERFYRVDKSHSKEIGGTGLGLSIVKHGAAYLGAAVTVESEPGNGSTFTLTWPE